MIGIAILVCVIPFVSYVALQFPELQTKIAKYSVESIEKNIDGKAEIGRVVVVFFNKIMIHDLVITDDCIPADTLLSIGKLSLSFSLADLLTSPGISLRRITVEDGLFSLKKVTAEGQTNLSKIFRIKPDPADTAASTLNLPQINVSDISLRDLHFRLQNPWSDTVPKHDSCMNFSDLDISGINIKISKAEYKEKVLTCRIRELSCMDKCGYGVKSLTGIYTMDSTHARLDNLNLMDTYSSINAGYLQFGYSSGDDLNDFCNKIVMGADFSDSYLDFRSIGVFAPSLRTNRLSLRINGEVTGPVKALRSEDLRITSGDSTDIRTTIAITGLPDIDSTLFDAEFHHLTTLTSDISEIVSFFSRKPVKGLDGIIPGTTFTLRGSAYGKLSDIASSGRITSEIGELTYNASTKESPSSGSREVKAHISAQSLHLGKIIKNATIGEATFTLSAQGVLRDNGGMDLNLDSLRIDNAYFRGYNFSDIYALGKIENGIADVRLLSHDRSLPLLFQGIVKFDEKFTPERLQIHADIPYADLSAINVASKENKVILGGRVRADLNFPDKHSFAGNLDIEKIHYSNLNGEYEIDSIAIKSTIEEEKNTITLSSGILNAEYNSTGTPADLLKRLKEALLARRLPILLQSSDTIDSEENKENLYNSYYTFHLETGDLSPICNVLMPGLYIGKGSMIDFSLDENNILEADMQSKMVRLGGNRMSGLILSIDNREDYPRCRIAGKELDLGGITLHNPGIIAQGTDDAVKVSIAYLNEGAEANALNLSGTVSFRKKSDNTIITTLLLDESDIHINGSKWIFAPAEIILDKKYYEVNNFRLSHLQQAISVDGAVSPRPDDELKLELKEFDISIISSFVPARLDLKGLFSGDITARNLFDEKGIIMSLNGEEVSLFGREIGHLTLMSKWDQSRKRFNILVNNILKEENPINVIGHYTPKRNLLNLDIHLKEFQLGYLDPFLASILTIQGGTFSGDLNLFGALDKLVLTGENCKIDSLRFIPTFTKVPYTLSGPISLNNHTIGLNSINIEDSHSRRATLNGTMTHDFFKDIYLDARLDFRNFHALNTTERDNSTFYGQAYATGNISINGHTSDLKIDANIRTNDKTAIHVPLSSASSASKTDLIAYDNLTSAAEEEPEEEEETSGKKVLMPQTKSKLEIHAKADITNETQLFVEMNKQLGEVLRCSGNGNINLTLNPTRNIMDLRGDYTISEGNYHFVMSMASRDFIIDEGGTLAFNGNLANTVLNLGATYRTKASISTLIADTTSVSNRRNVDCGVNLKGSLNNPEISFSIDIPDLDPITKGRVESALSTPDKIQKQFMALLISGSFVPDEQSGIINNTSVLFSNASEILSNQFNNIFRQLDIPLDLGLNYQPGTTGRKDMFDVALSYQAFNNRLIINGNVGNSETSSQWAGDFDAEIKVDKQGKLRVSLFTRAADSYSNFLDNTQRSGFGVAYQDEFDSLGEFWRNIFMSRKKREEYQIRKLLEAEEKLRKEAEAANIKKEEINKPKEDPIQYQSESGLIEYEK